MTRRSDSPHDALIDATIAAVATNGLAAFSLRTVTAAIGRSTAAVFHHFGSKDDLLAAAADVALSRDAAFHDALASDLAGVRLDAASATDVVARYIAARAATADPVARFFWEVSFNADRWTGASDARARHHAMQATFWHRLLAPLDDADALSACITDIVAMESLFASVLHGHADYDLLMRETIRQAFGAAASGIVEWLSVTPTPHAPRDYPRDGMAGKLIDSAARQILRHGVGALNHRRLTAIAGASPSMIVYHFGDTATFTQQAIWAALLRDLPPGLDYELPMAVARQGMETWYARLLRLLGVGDDHSFYVGYARIVGQTCLLARDTPTLVPLVRHMRILEGAGTYYSSLTQWPEVVQLTRAQAATFAVWIKGFAMSGAASTEAAASHDRLTQAIRVIRRPDSTDAEQALHATGDHAFLRRILVGVNADQPS